MHSLYDSHLDSVMAAHWRGRLSEISSQNFALLWDKLGISHYKIVIRSQNSSFKKRFNIITDFASLVCNNAV